MNEFPYQPSIRSKRFKLLINPRFQLSLVFHTFISTLMLLGAFFLANRYFIWKLLEKGHEMAIPSEHIYYRFVAEQDEAMSAIFLVTSVVVLIFHLLYGIYISNRIAGPIYRIKLYLEEKLNGESPQIKTLKFREMDYFHDLARLIHKAFHSKK